MDGKILVVGGYGKVGRTIAIELANRFPGQVIAAGRNYNKAEELARTTGMKILPLELDVFSFKEDSSLPEDINLVIMCLDLPNVVFVRKCLQRGIHYVDISATYELISQIEALDSEAKRHNATLVLSVGLAPGLTNLLAAHCKSKFERMERADIFVLLGLGEVHGEAAIRWTIENMNNKFSVQEDGVAKQVESLGEGKRTVFPDNIGAKTAYRFNFSDQHVIPKTLEVPSASTWLCFDSALTAYLFFLYKKIGLLSLLRFKQVRELLVKVFKTLHFGSDMFVMKIDAYGTAGGRDKIYSCSVGGNGEGRGTSLVAAEVAASLYTATFPPGVFHVEQLFEPAELIAKLRGKGLSFIIP
jgi:saccharopine dehydrogenase-like NADP-dependent oxidoreductase